MLFPLESAPESTTVNGARARARVGARARASRRSEKVNKYGGESGAFVCAQLPLLFVLNLNGLFRFH